MAKGMDEDFSIMIQFMEELAGLSTISEERRGNRIEYTQLGRTNLPRLIKSATAPGNSMATGP